MKVFSKDMLNDILDNCETLQQFKDQLAVCDKDIDLDVIDAVDGEVIVVSFPIDYGEGARTLLELLKQSKPNNPSIAIAKDIDIMIQYPEETLKMLDDMRDKILSQSKPNIVIP